jgi:hypothetical protein
MHGLPGEETSLMISPEAFSTGVAHRIGRYSDAVRVPAGAEYAAARSEVIKHEPTFMLGVVSGLAWPQIRVEIEVTAVIPAAG